LFPNIAHSQIEKFKYFPLGYDFTGGRGGEVIPRRDAEMGRHTSHLFLFAIEQSGSGPPRGVMHVSDDFDKDEMPGGTAAFLRAVQRYLPMSFRDLETVGEYAKRKRIPKEIEREKDMPPISFFGNEEQEKGTRICKVAVNPLLILLHVDQGSFANGSYTPFATPKANNRSIYKENVDLLSMRLIDQENVVKGEDFSIVPYKASVGNKMSVIQQKLSRKLCLLYRCTLNRDPESEQVIISKEAVVTDSNFVSELMEVSGIPRAWHVTPY
jgi:hypothetical protein